jgi:hypothetical protein
LSTGDGGDVADHPAHAVNAMLVADMCLLGVVVNKFALEGPEFGNGREPASR